MSADTYSKRSLESVDKRSAEGVLSNLSPPAHTIHGEPSLEISAIFVSHLALSGYPIGRLHGRDGLHLSQRKRASSFLEALLEILTAD